MSVNFCILDLSTSKTVRYKDRNVRMKSNKCKTHSRLWFGTTYIEKVLFGLTSLRSKM